MNVQLRPELHSKLERIAAQQRREPQDLVQEAVERFLDYDEWFMREVEKGLAALRPLAPLFYRWLFGDVETLYKRLLDQGSAAASDALRELRIGYKCTRGNLSSIPASGPAIVICNHPFGVLEGLILGSVLPGRRDDVKCLGNFMASTIAQVRERIIPIDTLGGPDAARMNGRSIRECVEWLRSGGLLVLFPAGDVGSRRFPSFRPVDGKWNTTAALMAKWTHAPVIPFFFHGGNHWTFDLMGLIHRELRDALVAREMMRKRGHTIRFAVGEAIDGRALVEKWGLHRATDLLRGQTYGLR